GSNLGGRLPPFGVSVLKYGQGALDPVLQDALEDVYLPLDVDEAGLQLLHVDAAGELQVELVEGEQVGQGHGVAHDHDVPAVGIDDGTAADVVRGIRDHRQR